MLKHVGQIINTGRRAVVVFRYIYNEAGTITDKHSCLVVETDSLPDAIHQDIMRIIESNQAQTTGNLYDVFARERFSDGSPALNWLHQNQRLRKYPTDNIMMTPDNNVTLRLDKLNRILEMQEAGLSQQQIDNAMVDDTDGVTRKETTATMSTPVPDAPVADGVLDDAAIAKSLLEQAKTFQAEADRLTGEAYDMDPDLKPKRGRPKKEAVTH